MAAVNSIRNIFLSEWILKYSRLCICTVEDSKIAISRMIFQTHSCNFICNNKTLFEIRKSTYHLHFLANLIFRENILCNLFCVFLNQTVGRIYNVLCRPIILFEFKHFCLGEIRFEIKYIINICSAEWVDTLRIITNNTHTMMLISQLFNYKMLSKIGILIFINKDILKLISIFIKHLFVITKQDISVQQQIIKIHAVTRTQTVLISFVYFEKLRLSGSTIKINDLSISGIHCRSNQTVFCSWNLSVNRSRSILLIIKIHIFNNKFNQIPRIGWIKYRIIWLKTDWFGLITKDTGKDWVECTHPQSRCKFFTYK